ncbi:MAG: response regulator [Eubacterium sp.]|nr:response regulator [Eubacterium sp.]
MEITPQSFYEKQIIHGHGYILPIFFNGKEIDLYIAIDSDINVGTTPLDIKVKVDSSTSEGAENKPTVVIVDDSGWSRTILRNLLEKNGFAIIGEAGNGSEAIEVYKKCKPDVITLDITMPTMDGIEALRNIMEFDPSAKAAMITSAGQRSKVLESLKLGAEKFITKPFDPNLVLTELKSLVKEKYPDI